MSIRYRLITALLGCLVLAAPARSQHTQEDIDLLERAHPERFLALTAEHPTLDLTSDREAGISRFVSGETNRPNAIAAVDPQVWRLRQQISQQWNPDANSGAGDWEVEGRVFLSYNDAGFEIELLFEDWDADAGEWVLESRRVTTRDSQNRVVEYLYQDWDAEADGGEGAWVSLQRQAYSYNARGNTLMSTTEIWNEEEQKFDIFFRTTNTYDGTGEFVVERIFETGLFGPVRPSSRRSFTYNSDGRVTEEFVEQYDATTSAWRNSALVQSTYDDNGELVEEIELDWDAAANAGAGDWVNDTRYLASFSPNSASPTEIVETDQVWDPGANAGAGAWVNDERTVATYTSAEIVETDQVWDSAAGGGAGAWVNEEREIDRFSGAGDYLETVNQVWDGAGQGSWVNEERGSIERDANGLITVFLSEQWDGTSWVNDSRLLMVYDDSEQTAAESESPRQRFQLGENYPNPFSDKTTISFTLAAPGHVTLDVFDMLGRKVTTLVDVVAPAGTHRAVLKGTGMAGGLYLYRLQGDGFRASRTFLLVK